MQNKNCFIIGAGSFQGMSLTPQKDDLVIAADGGYNYLKESGIEPDVLMGDFDSIDIIPEDRHLIRHSPIKDDTDMALAVAYAAEQGYHRFFLYGGLGGRLDHTLANLMLLNGISKSGFEAYLIGEGIMITAITGERIHFSEKFTGTISVFCLGETCTGVTEEGLKYVLEHAELSNTMTLGVSNEFIGKESSIETESGTLILIWNEKNGLPVKRTSLSGRKIEHGTFLSEMGKQSMQEGQGELIQSKGYRGV